MFHYNSTKVIQVINKSVEPARHQNNTKNVKKIPTDINKFMGFISIPPEEQMKFAKQLHINDISITTITAQCKPVSQQTIDLSLLKKSMINNNLLTVQQGEKEFKNQMSLSISYQTEPKLKKISIKIFGTGTIHVCGLPNTSAMKTTLNIIKDLIKRFNNIPVIYDHDKIIESMIVGVADMKTQLNLRNLSKILMTKYDVYVKYEPNVYCGLNCKFNGATILIFSSGKILPSAKNLNNLIKAVEFIRCVISQNNISK